MGIRYGYLIYRFVWRVVRINWHHLNVLSLETSRDICHYRKCSLAVCPLWLFFSSLDFVSELNSHFSPFTNNITFRMAVVYSLRQTSTQSTQPYTFSKIPRKMIHNRSNFGFQRKRNENLANKNREKNNCRTFLCSSSPPDERMYRVTMIDIATLICVIASAYRHQMARMIYSDFRFNTQSLCYDGYCLFVTHSLRRSQAAPVTDFHFRFEHPNGTLRRNIDASEKIYIKTLHL